MSKTLHLPLCSLIAVLLACGGEAPIPDREPPSVPSSTAPAAAGRDSKPTASTGAGVSFLLESGFLYAGETPIVHFDRPVPAEGGHYWITVVDSAQSDDKWGAWRYIDAGATEVPLWAVNSPGWYEVRFHDRYPKLSTHVISRAVLEVVEAPAPEAPSRTARTQSDSWDDSSQLGAVEPETGDNPFDRVSFKTESEVLALVGPPVAKLVEDDRTRWYYEDQYPIHFGELACPELHFMDGEVMSVVWYPPPAMSDHIETARLHKGVRRSASTATRPQTFTYDQANDMSHGRSRREITDAFGEPTSKKWIEGREVWQYDDLVYEADGSYLFAIVFDGDQVLDVQAIR